jgi:5-methylcytosine-specific restriction endonuclease McrA
MHRTLNPGNGVRAPGGALALNAVASPLAGSGRYGWQAGKGKPAGPRHGRVAERHMRRTADCSIAVMGRKRSWSDEQFAAAVAQARSVRQVLQVLGLVATGGNYVSVRRHVTRLGLSTDHFLGNRWNIGVSPGLPPIPLTEILVENSAYTNRDRMKRRLLREGMLANRCYECGLTDWRGKPISLQLEHRNGRNNDHRLENLELLCPNCHSQTLTFAGRNVGRVAKQADALDSSPSVLDLRVRLPPRPLLSRIVYSAWTALGYSSIGRAPASGAGGSRFESLYPSAIDLGEASRGRPS